MKRGALLAVVLMAGVFVAVTCCGAGAVIAPDWRGQAGTTYGDWGFGDDANPAVPDAANNPYGVAEADIVVGDFGTGWAHQLLAMGSETDYWDLGSAGTIGIGSPGSIPAGGYIDVLLQVVFFRDISAAPAVFVDGGVLGASETRLVENVATGGQWLLYQSEWTIGPAPGGSSDGLFINVIADADWGSVVSRMVVDAAPRGVPEPASSVALAAGLLGLLRCRAARRKSGV